MRAIQEGNGPLTLANMAEREIVDRKGKPYTVRTFVFPTREQDSLEVDPRIARHRAEIEEVMRLAFRDVSDGATETQGRLKWISKDDVIELIFDKNDDTERVIGVQTYLSGQMPEYDGARYLYNHYSAIHPDYQGRALRRISSQLVKEQLEPSAIAASTHGVSYYKSFHEASVDFGHLSYPRTGVEVPQPAFELGQTILKHALGPDYAITLDQRLVRTGKSPYTMDDDERRFPFFEDELALRPEQAAFCLSIEPNFATQIGIEA